MSHKLKLKRLVLQGFKRHANLTIEFSDTLTVIRGANGRGKSSILEAIYFTLGGVSCVPGDSKEIPHNGGKCDTWMYFEKAGEEGEYCLYRSMKDAELSHAGKLLATGHTAVNAEVVEMLGMPMKLFQALTYARQSETAALLTLGASALNVIVEEVAEAQYIADVEGQSTALSVNARTKLEMIEEPQDVTELRSSLAGLSLREAALKIEQNQIDVMKEPYVARRDKAGTELKAAQEIARVRKIALAAQTEARITHARVESELGAINVALTETPAVDATASQKEVDEIAAKIEAARERNKEHASSTTKATAKLETLATIQKANTLCDELEPKITQAQAGYDASLQLQSAQELTVNTLAIQLKTAKKSKANAICSECNRPLDTNELNEASEKVVQLSSELDKAEKALAVTSPQTAELKTALGKLQKQCPVRSTEECVAKLYEELAEIQAKIGKPVSASTISTMESKWLEHSNVVTTANKQNKRRTDLLAQQKTALVNFEKAKGEMNDIKDQLEQLVEKDMAVLEAEYNAAQESVSDILNRAHLAYVAWNEADEALKNANTAIAKAEDLTQKRVSLERRRVAFDGLTKYLRTNRAVFMADLWDRIMLQTSCFVANITDNEITQIGRGEDGKFFYVENGVTRGAITLAGGWKAVAGVGLMLALGSILPAGIALSILDEPSSELRDEVAGALAGGLLSTGRQIVMVTHRTGEEFVSDSLIELG